MVLETTVKPFNYAPMDEFGRGEIVENSPLCWWAIRDSNPGPTGYEPVALTN